MTDAEAKSCFSGMIFKLPPLFKFLADLSGKLSTEASDWSQKSKITPLRFTGKIISTVKIKNYSIPS